MACDTRGSKLVTILPSQGHNPHQFRGRRVGASRLYDAPIRVLPGCAPHSVVGGLRATV